LVDQGQKSDGLRPTEAEISIITLVPQGKKTFRIGTKEIGLPRAKPKTLSTCSKGLKGYPNLPVNGGGGSNKMYLQRGLATPYS
jgi:hypothetical protein